MSLACLALWTVLAAPAAWAASSQAQQPLWTLETESEIVFQKMTPVGLLLVSTQEGLLGVEPADGSVVWTRPDIRNRFTFPPRDRFSLPARMYAAEPRFLWGTPYGLITVDSGEVLRRAQVIDLRTGDPRWDSDALGVRDVIGHFQLPGNEMLLLYGTPSSDGPGRHALLAVDLETGILRWRVDDLFRKRPVEFQDPGSPKDAPFLTLWGHQPPAFDTDSTAIFFLSKDGPIKLDLRTGKKIWATDLKADPPALLRGYARMLLAGDVLYIPYRKTIQALGVVDGLPRWSKPPRLKGTVAQMELTSVGLLVRGTPQRDEEGRVQGGSFFLALVDPATGGLQWMMEGVRTPFLVEDDWVYVATEQAFHRVRLADGEPEHLADFKFQGGESPVWLEKRDGNFLLVSTQNLQMLDSAGAVVYQAYFEAPPAALLGKIVGVVLVAAMVYGAATYGGIVPTSILFWSRDKTSLYTRNHVYIVARNAAESGDGGPGLVKVNKDTGRVEARSVLGEKSPEYEVDAEGRLLMFKSGRSTIECYVF